MQWSKPFSNILLILVCASVIKFSLANRVTNNAEIEAKQNHEISKIKPTLQVFEGSTNSLVLDAEPESLKPGNDKRRLQSNPVSVAPKQYHINNGIKPHGTNNPFSTIPEKNYPGKQKWSIVNGKFRDVKQTSLQSRITNRKLLNDEAYIGEFSNQRKRLNQNMLTSHRIAKRNVNMSDSNVRRLIPPECSGQKSCSGRCTGNITEWRTDESFTCYCDTACYEMFNDCCADYIKYCGEQKPSDISIKKFKWTCEKVDPYRYGVYRQIWMVSRCAVDWPSGPIRINCENPAKRILLAFDTKRYIPAVGGNVIFRNYFCAICNHIDVELEYFPVKIKTNVIPPEHYSFMQKVKFLLSNNAAFPAGDTTLPKSSQPRRYCLQLVDFCIHDNTTSDACTNGPVALVSGSTSKHYKNYDCALCNDHKEDYACFPSFLPRYNDYCPGCLPQKFLLNLDYKDTNDNEDSVFTILSTPCGRSGLTFDGKLQECVENIPTPDGIEEKFRILVWLVPSRNVRFTENDFKAIMKQYVRVDESQLYNIIIDIQLHSRGFTPTIAYHLIRSTLLLTPEQSFDLSYKTDSNPLNLRSFIYFQNPLNVTLNEKNFTIIKTTSRHLSCITRTVITPQEYDVLDNDRIYVKSTNTSYRESEYYGQINGNITICKVYSPGNCEKILTGLTKNYFIINTNLSLYLKNAGMLYAPGQYVVFNNSIALCKGTFPRDSFPTCSSEHSCRGRCSKQTEWRTEFKMRCSCDPDCYEVFNDCCSDYTKYCGAQKPTETPTKKYNYTCEKIGDVSSLRNYCFVDVGLWTVTRCRPKWPYDIFRTKCEAPLDNLDMPSPDLYSYLPVLGHENTTFRNMYCAICNGVWKFEPWPLYTVTPKHFNLLHFDLLHFNLTEQIHFLLRDGANFSLWSPGENLARRYCVRNIIESCPPDVKFESCTNGDVALISNVMNRYVFKNSHCAACRGIPREAFLCFRHYIGTKLNCFLNQAPLSFSLVLDHNLVKTEIKERVSKYEKEYGGIDAEENEQIPKRFYIYSWLEPPRNSQNISFAPTEYHESLEEYLNVSHLQLFDINITTVLRPETTTSFFYIVSSTIILTPQQSLELLHTSRNKNISTEAKLLNYIYFSKPFTLHIKGIPYTVTKTTLRPLTCVEKRTFTPDEYTLQDQEEVFIPSTNKTYKNFEYYRENAEQLERGNITVCEKYIPIKCNGSMVLYKPKEYSTTVNLSIYVKETSSLYGYGEYEILSNKSVAICQYFKVHLTTETRQTILNNEVLGHITLVSFLLSILSLIFLLVTYILFPQLRTLPGKNLMNFSANLLLLELFWLPSSFTEVRSDKPTCMALAVVEHYFLMASFVSMSVIAFHTCKVFARRLLAPKKSEGHERKLFCMYLACVWLVPGIFVGICVVLDYQDVVKVGYGKSEICWLTEDKAYTYFVIIPIAVLLLFNIIAFVISAIYLRKHGQNTAARQASGNRRSNFLIYIKLSTLMGFTWLFGLMALVVTSTAVFWYFFVIFTSLQGVFVAVAFVMNVKTFGLYKQWYSSGSRTPKTNRPKKIVPMKVINVKEL